MISDDEEKEEEESSPDKSDKEIWSEQKAPQSILFDLNGPETVREDVTAQGRKQRQSLKSEEDHSMKLLKIHQKMGHTSFAKLQQLAKQGALPKALAKCQIPLRTICEINKDTLER